MANWNENTPANTDLISGGPAVIKQLKTDIRERMDNEHAWTATGANTEGTHKADFITESSGYIQNAAITNAKLKDATATPGAAKIPIADGSGKLANGWLNTGTGNGLDADTLDGSHASAFAVAAKGVTNGDTHNHSGGDGDQIDHTTLSNIGTNTHAQIDTHISTGAHVTNGDSHDHSGGDGAQINHTTLSNIGTTSHSDIDSHIAATTSVHGITVTAAAINGVVGGSIIDPTSITNPNSLPGNIISAGTQRTTTSTSYTKVKEITLTKGGTYYVYFHLLDIFAGPAYGRIYKNGVAFGTEHNTGDGEANDHYESLTFDVGDKVQLYIKAWSGGSARSERLNLYWFESCGTVDIA